MKLSALFPTAVLTLAIFGQPAFAAIKTETVEYQSGGTTFEGLISYDDAATTPRPGVLVVQDWTGVGDYVKGRAEQLAALGYVAFCADIYGKGVRPTTPEECGKLATKYKNDRPELRRRVAAGLAQLVKNPRVQKTEVAAIGYCFGGTTVLELARSGAELRGVVSFHGGLSTPTPADAKAIQCPLLICHGEDDPFVKPDEVKAFLEEMTKGSVDYELIQYPGAVHAFTRKDAGSDNSKGAAYQEEADHKSWESMKLFLAKAFGRSAGETPF